MIGFIGTSITNTLNCNNLSAHNQSIPYWTTSVFSSTVTDLVLMYESAISSTNGDSITNGLSFITRGEPKRDHHLQLFVYWSVTSAATGMRVWRAIA
jgi:hypothetical protein